MFKFLLEILAYLIQAQDINMYIEALDIHVYSMWL